MRHILSVIVTVIAAAVASHAAERDISVRSADGTVLAGTLSVPDSAPRAAVLLVTGSGAQDRDEEIFGHRPFMHIARHLSDAGYAVLRLDDRGAGQSTGDFGKAVDADFLADIDAAMCALDSACAGVPLGIIGHSSGGQLAVRSAASPRSRASFIVTLAAPAWRGDSLIMSQTRALAVGLSGKWEAEGLQRRLLDIAMQPLPPLIVRPMLMTALSEKVPEAMRSDPKIQAQIAAGADALLSPWYRDMLRYDPAADISAVAVPWLALNGSRDTQVLPANLETIAQLNPQARTVVNEGLNHLFLTCTTGLVNEYPTLPQSDYADLCRIITDWLGTLDLTTNKR